MDRNKKLFGVGIAGTVIAALCCFTPVLVILFGVVGLSALVGYLDYVLLPALAFFLGLTIYAVYRRKKMAC
ncbi:MULTISPECIES: mercury resistance system transport protein MerF [Salinisphaera]|jgi:mercuric ion transport protein|uniref:Membrane protein n=1 Tax=Salinisphaera orenii MK-B5 TaxID=856730 RepID=A0A423PGJ6_9GAMM|nr:MULTISPECIES: mercury resistance system transport protein MerF [Salinisphaera]MAS09584.1 hypothetical protein [Salinisphaera sp.]MAS09801.1 hypothetical protein [Salinisphaera sp.]ROO24684.1 membrane protein [Salinisphaera orenii MK-B5]|tara:strand:+ start:493 stop:705 length:213 start_codon:yes stop_codon:yes gene_type:complete